MSETVKLAPPWMLYVKELEELFRRDSEVRVGYDEGKTCIKQTADKFEIGRVQTVTLYVNNEEKYEALDKLMIKEMEFGGVTVRVRVVPANVKQKSTKELVEAAFKGNPVFHGCKDDPSPMHFTTYALFSAIPVQYVADDISSPYGVRTVLIENIVKKHMNLSGMSVCSDLLK